MHVLIRIWSHRTSASVCFFGNDRSSHSRIRISLDPMSVYYEWTSDQFACPSPCNNSCYARASPRVKKLDQRFQDLVQPRPQGFSLEKWVGHPIHFLREKPWGRVGFNAMLCYACKINQKNIMVGAPCWYLFVIFLITLQSHFVHGQLGTK